MLIDWFTIVAQALNFLILVWLLKHFLYKPILHAIDAREKRIATELADADTKKAEAQKEQDEFQHKNEEFDQQRAALLSKATDEAKAERQRLLDEARKAADALSAKRQETLRNDARNLSQSISLRTQQEVLAIARKALTDLATTSLEERMGEVFTRRLREMDGQAKAGLGEAIKTSSDPALVRSAFDLPADQRAAIQNALNETFSADVHIRFETAPDLISGIELVANGHKVAWSIADYLASLGKGLDELLKEKEEAEAKAAPKPEPKAESKPGAKAEAQPKPEATGEPKPETKAEAASEVKPDPKPAPEAKTKLDANTEPKPAAKAEPKPEVQVKPEAKDEPKPATKAEAAPEVKTDPKPAPEAKTKLDTNTEPKPAVKAAPKPEVQVKPEAKDEPKPANKSGTASE
jgi:F-type H+-transporting ATPase subunit b